MKTLKFGLMLAASLMLCAPNVYANLFDDQFGNKITSYDNRSDLSTNTWYNRGNPGEDQEVEPGMVQDQRWDLEGFLLKNQILSIVAGFDLKDGYTYGGQLYKSGDIFIDVISENFGAAFNGYTYEYAFDMDYSTLKYSVVELSNASVFDIGQLIPNHNDPLSAPWRYQSGGGAVSGWGSVSFTYYDFGNSLMTDASTGYSGNGNAISTDDHNALSVNLGFLPVGTAFVSHFTIECGNDNLMGQVPEPATLLLLGLGLMGVGILRRKQ